MADVSRKLKRIVADLERQGVRVRSSKAGWVAYLPGRAIPLTMHTTPRRPEVALLGYAHAIAKAGLTIPPGIL